MTKILGKKATVTFEVISQDEETEQLLQKAIFNAINPLVDQGKDNLKALLTISSVPRKKKEHATPEDKYAKENVEMPELIPLGGEWAYSVAIVTDERNVKSVRVAKGKIKGNFYRDKKTNEMKLMPDDPMNPISLVNKISLKRMSEWQKLQTPILKRLQVLEDLNK